MHVVTLHATYATADVLMAHVHGAPYKVVVTKE